VLPDLAPGDALKLLELHPAQHFTTPPPRYGEAKLVSELEKRGIGRPSTYASIISTIQDRGYVRLENRRFYAEKMGEIVTERLQNSFSDLLDYGFTAGMEEHLDEVAGGRVGLAQALLDTFLCRFQGSASRRPASRARRHAGQCADDDRYSLHRLRPADADPHGEHRGVPRLLRLRAAAQGALQGDDQPRSPGTRRSARMRMTRPSPACCAASIAASCATRRWTYLIDESASSTSAATTRTARVTRWSRASSRSRATTARRWSATSAAAKCS
jgi:hypothetical protein